jgi:glycosyltransferase involved in cell wall biosynthesis
MAATLAVDVLLDARVVERGHTGIARYVRELAARLPEVAPIRLSALVTREETRVEGVTTHVRMRAPFLHPAEQAELPLRAAAWRGWKRRHGVVWTPAFNAACVTPGPLVLTLHDANHLAVMTNHPWAHFAYYQSIVKLAASRASGVIAVSEFAKQEIVARIGVPEAKIHVVHNGVSAPPTPSADSIARVRAARGLPERYVAYLGNFKPHKNLDTLLRAAATFAKEVPLALIGGTEAELGNALPAARSLGAHVIVMRQVPDEELWPILAGASVFVMPSRYEGFGLPPLEAMSLGVPVISSNAGALPEVVGDAALLVYPDDVAGFCKAIERVLNEPALAASLVQKGRARAGQLTWDAAARATARVLQDAARP